MWIARLLKPFLVIRSCTWIRTIIRQKNTKNPQIISDLKCKKKKSAAFTKQKKIHLDGSQSIGVQRQIMCIMHNTRIVYAHLQLQSKNTQRKRNSIRFILFIRILPFGFALKDLLSIGNKNLVLVARKWIQWQILRSQIEFIVVHNKSCGNSQIAQLHWIVIKNCREIFGSSDCT